VPLNATEYFPNLSSQLAVLLATRVADKIVSFSKLNESNSTPAQANVTTKDLTEKEKAALQYLGGYVLLALNKRIQQSKKWKTASREH
jgi:p-aminobenzoyl-glutamate transporter AbgT